MRVFYFDCSLIDLASASRSGFLDMKYQAVLLGVSYMQLPTNTPGINHSIYGASSSVCTRNL